jgi:hypothetical protein
MAAMLTGCVGMRSAYESIDLQALVIVGAMIPFGEALQSDRHGPALAKPWRSRDRQLAAPAARRSCCCSRCC